MKALDRANSSVLIANFSPWITPKPGSTGKPSPLYDIDLINSEGKPCEDGEEGEIVVRLKGHDWPTGLFTGYYLDDEMTKANLGGEWYNTKDVAWRTATVISGLWAAMTMSSSALVTVSAHSKWKAPSLNIHR